MSKIVPLPSRVPVRATRRFLFLDRDERGQATAEYGVVLLVAVALGMAVLMLFTGRAFDDVLTTLLKKVLQTAAGMIRV